MSSANTALKAIETHYKGYRFRSRLEARWAVFFDALGVTYAYEPEGYDLGDGFRYLPDFWLPGHEWYIEIKPTEPTQREIECVRRLAAQSGKHVVLLEGTPRAPRMDLEWDSFPEEVYYKAHIAYGHCRQWLSWGIQYDIDTMHEFLAGKGIEAPEWDGRIETLRTWTELDEAYYYCEYGNEHPRKRWGPADNNLAWGYRDDELTLIEEEQIHPYGTDARLRYAYKLAQQARFEHGETPTVRPYWEALPTMVTP